ncbi:MAG: hypothetical protein DWQ02_17060 [Bacteroidetes bacterium]|nr:MAG: hypothetical protein DWQ02_17060 [Bacteroidota bacterium]
MKIRQKTLVNCLGLLVLLNVFSCSPQKEESSPPNVILIISDDQGYADLGCTGLADDVQTPNMDRLAASGTRFTQAYATSPICNPSRAGVLTGCYQQRWGTFWYGGKGIHDPEFKTIAEILKANGYATGYVGKVHYGSNDGDTTNRNFPLNHGFDYYYGHTSARKHYLNHVQKLEDEFQKVKKEHEKWGQSLRQQPLWENFDLVDTVAFATELFGQKACEYISKHQDEPFFLQLSFNAVHNFTHQLPQEYLDEKGLTGYHDWDPAKEDYYEWYQAGRKPNHPEGRELYLGQLHYLDLEIGRLLDHLEQLNLDQNTLIVYLSDNGGSTPIYANNYPLRGSKYVLYEGGIRVPMIIALPGQFEKGVILDNVISAMDVLPTICAMTNIPVPEYVDGLDLSSDLASGNDQIFHDTLYWDTGLEAAVRAGKWKYRMAVDDKNAKYEMVEIELGDFLYDLEADPGETTNLAEEYPLILLELKRSHERWKHHLQQ